jgi:hypothetical protein
MYSGTLGRLRRFGQRWPKTITRDEPIVLCATGRGAVFASQAECWPTSDNIDSDIDELHDVARLRMDWDRPITLRL